MPEITIALRVADGHRVTVATTMPQPQVGAPLCVTQSLALDAINAIKRNPRCAGVEWGQQDSKDHKQGLDSRDAAFEAVRKAFCKIQRYSFFLDGQGNVRRCADHSGNWVEFSEVHTLFEPQCVDAALAAHTKQGEQANG